MIDSSFIPSSSQPLVPKYGMDFGPAKSLAPFKDQYLFFSPALLYLFGHFTDFHLLNFLREVNRDVKIMFHTFSRPIFAGLKDGNGDPGWNHTLWAVEKTDWLDLENYVLSVAIYDTKAGRVYRTGTQDVNVVDPLWLDLNGVVHRQAPRLDLAVFGVDCNIAQLALDLRSDPPAAVRFPPQARTKAFAKHILGREDTAAAQALLDGPLPPPPKTPVSLDLRSFDTMSSEKQQEIIELIRRYKQEFRT